MSGYEQRNARLFISSTFQDMQAERDALNAFVFPYIKAVCAGLRVEFLPVDLRWGITREQAQSGETVRVCLREAERCNLFLGIIGQRYGWIPPTSGFKEHQRLFAREISVTEAEITQGALRRPNGDTRAIFCFRDARYSARLGFRGEQAELRRLARLKKKIREKGFPLLRGYASIEEFIAFVKDALESAVHSMYGSPAELDEYIHEKQSQDFMRERLCFGFFGRQKDIASLDCLINQNDKPVLLAGANGAGKSALLAKWAERCTQTRQDAFFFYHNCNASANSADWAFLVRRLMRELADFWGVGVEPIEDKGRLLGILPSFLSLRESAQIIIAIDGIELLAESDEFGLAWLPAGLAPHVRMIIAANRRAAMLLCHRGYARFTIRPLSGGDISGLIDSYLSGIGKRFSDSQKQMICTSRAAKLPLYLLVLLTELALHGVYETLDETIRGYLEARDIEQLFERVLARIEKSYGSGESPIPLREILCLMFASRRGVREDELTAMLGIPQARWLPLYWAIRPYVNEYDGFVWFSSRAFYAAVRHFYRLHASDIAHFRRIEAGYLAANLNEARAPRLAWLYYRTNAAGMLGSLLSAPEYISCLSHEKNAFKLYWSYVERRTRKSRETCYLALFKRGFAGNQVQTGFDIALFLSETGFFAAAALILNLILRADTEEYILLPLLGVLANVERRRGRVSEALAALEQKRLLCEKTGDALELARTHGNIGNIMAGRGQLEEAFALYRDAEAIFRREGYLQGLGAALGNMGSVCLMLERYDEAAGYFIEREELCRESHNTAGMIEALGNIAALHLRTQDFSKAQIVLECQESLCRKIGDMAQYSEIQGRKAILCSQSEEYEKAETLFLEKLRLCEKTDYYEGWKQALYNLYELYMKTQRIEAATNCASRLTAISLERGAVYDFLEGKLCLAKACAVNKNEKEAQAALTELTVLAHMHGYKRLFDERIRQLSKYINEED